MMRTVVSFYKGLTPPRGAVPVRLAAVALAALVATMPAAHAMAAPDSVAGDNAAPVVPAGVLDGALRGTAAGNAALLDFLGARGKPAIPGRAAAVIAALQGAGRLLARDRLVAGVDRVAATAVAALAAMPVARLALAPRFKPDGAVLAWDFGPAAQPPAPGFTRIPSDDPRLAGVARAAWRADAPHPLLGAGLRGLAAIELSLPPGSYRLILIVGNGGADAAPLGRRLRVNGIAATVATPARAGWVDAAILANDPALTVQLSGAGGAGVAVVALRTGGGRMRIIWEDGRAALAGLIVERDDVASLVRWRGPESRFFTPLARRIALEAEITAVAAQFLAAVAPGAGGARAPADAAFAPRDVASPN
jgi:hypothetical protein